MVEPKDEPEKGQGCPEDSQESNQPKVVHQVAPDETPRAAIQSERTVGHHLHVHDPMYEFR